MAAELMIRRLEPEDARRRRSPAPKPSLACYRGGKPLAPWGPGMEDSKLIAYIGRLKEQIATLRSADFTTSEERVSCEAVADSLELVVRELTDLIEIR